MNVTDMPGCQFEGQNEFRSSDTIYKYVLDIIFNQRKTKTNYCQH